MKLSILGLDTEVKKEDIIKALEKQNNVEIYKTQVHKEKELRNKTKSVVISLPCSEARRILMNKKIAVGFSIDRTEIYSTVRQCYNCGLLGHTRMTCRYKSRLCFKCNDEHDHEGCTAVEAICVNCTNGKTYQQ